MKHTPGLWELVPFGSTHTEQSLYIKGPHNTGGFKDICRISDKENNKDKEANAHLIAAAPDLLEACEDAASTLFNVTKSISRAYRDDRDFTITLKRLDLPSKVKALQKIITKAKGEN